MLIVNQLPLPHPALDLCRIDARHFRARESIIMFVSIMSWSMFCCDFETSIRTLFIF
jgi:hypothetical protein